MDLIKNSNDLLFKTITKLKNLDIRLTPIEVRKCMYKYNEECDCKTNIEINEWDGRTVMLKGNSIEEMECDWQYLNRVIKGIVSKRKEKNCDDFQYEACFNDKNRLYVRPYEILSSNYFNQYPNGRVYITGYVASLLDKLDKCILEFAKKENAVEFYSEPLWYEEELDKFGYSTDNDSLFKIDNLGNGKNIYWQNAVCDNIWESLENSVIDKFSVYSSIGMCGRTEKNQTYFYERMNTFHMREIVAVGCKDEIIEFRKRAIKFVTDFANKLQLNFLLEKANDPFFIEDNSIIDENKENLRLPETVKVEFRPCLYDNETLECASFNIYGNFFAKKFNYTGKEENQEIWTSCIAFGLERWCWAILAQFGTDIYKWPRVLQTC